jgi:hypothetical protein
MAVVPQLEGHLAEKAAIEARLRYREGARQRTDKILSFLGERSLVPHSDSISITFDAGRFGLELIVRQNHARSRPELGRGGSTGHPVHRELYGSANQQKIIEAPPIKLYAAQFSCDLSNTIQESLGSPI